MDVHARCASSFSTPAALSVLKSTTARSTSSASTPQVPACVTPRLGPVASDALRRRRVVEVSRRLFEAGHPLTKVDGAVLLSLDDQARRTCRGRRCRLLDRHTVAASSSPDAGWCLFALDSARDCGPMAHAN